MMLLSRYSKAVLMACLLAFVVVALGAFTRLVDAGLGCPDWPGCYGQLMWPKTGAEIQQAEQLFPDAPVDTNKTWPEMVHRYFAGVLGLVILGLAITAWRSGDRHRPVKLPLLLVLLVVVQALFGMWTVTLKLWPQVVTAHLLGGFSTLSLLWLLFLRCYRREAVEEVAIPSSILMRRLRRLASIGLIAVVVQIALGGWTSSNYAALACIDFPTCHGEWLPETDFSQGFDISQTLGPNYLGGLMDNQARTAIHFSHRVGALVVVLVSLMLAVSLWRGGLRVLSTALLLILGLQVALGITNILAALPLLVAVAHNGVGALLLLTFVTINYKLYVYSKTPEGQ